MKRMITMFAALAVVGASLTALPAVAQDQATERVPTTGSHIDPKARVQMMEPIMVGGATEAGRAVPLDASEKQAKDRPAIGEVDAAQWLPETDPASSK